MDKTDLPIPTVSPSKDVKQSYLVCCKIVLFNHLVNIDYNDIIAKLVTTDKTSLSLNCTNVEDN